MVYEIIPSYLGKVFHPPTIPQTKQPNGFSYAFHVSNHKRSAHHSTSTMHSAPAVAPGSAVVSWKRSTRHEALHIHSRWGRTAEDDAS